MTVSKMTPVIANSTRCSSAGSELFVVVAVGTDKSSSPQPMLFRSNWECFRRPHRVPVEFRGMQAMVYTASPP